jgi:hypothetical protein
MEKAIGESFASTAIRKTADDEDEKDSEMTLNLGSPAFGCFPSLVKNLKMAAANTH